MALGMVEGETAVERVCKPGSSSRKPPKVRTP